MATTPELRAHQEWIGFVQPVGLVVSPTALLAAQAQVDRYIGREQDVLKALVAEETRDEGTTHVWLPDLPAFFCQFLGWEPTDLAGGPGGPELPASLDIALPDYDDVLTPTYGVPDPAITGGSDANADGRGWLLLVRAEAPDTPLDAPVRGDERKWQASPQARFERLLRSTSVPIGVLTNRAEIRLVYAPPLESTGHLTFRIADLCTTAGRPLVSALLMLLGARRLFSGPVEHRLPAILRQSRRYQNEVSTELAEQVLAALNALLRGFRSANDVSGGVLLADVLREDPNEVYGGLLATLMRLVFVLYAEDRDLMPGDEVYRTYYSVAALFEQLRDDAARYPDTMEGRSGAWSRLLTLFRLIHDGGAHGTMRLPARHGRLFDPDAYPFLEGRPHRANRVIGERLEHLPRVSDGVVYTMLKNLLLLQGERLSYRTLDVEQIGSVYEAMMGYALRVADGPSIALRPNHVVINLRELLDVAPERRAAWLKEQAQCEVRGAAVRDADTVDALIAALERRISPATPHALRAGDMYLQPTDERRRSGSHYTPRTLTAPIVKTTLKPILEALGEHPTPEQILELKVCDPAMGSGAFLVEACRHLAEALVSAWRRHDATPAIPPDEDVLRHAQRVVAQRCLYGVDRNPFAVDLAKLSLWLATFAKDHPFTFLDHALKAGDSLVGLSREQIASLHWAPSRQMPLVRALVDERVARARDLRLRIEAMADSDDTAEKARLLRDANQALDDLRLIGDVVVASFFGRDKARARETLRAANAAVVERWLGDQGPREEVVDLVAPLLDGAHTVTPFHWQLEFPEVFVRERVGFDAFVGNPPFAGGSSISTRLGRAYLDWVLLQHPESHGNGDLVAHFFRRAFNLLRPNGTFGLIATNTIGQGDTRTTGLLWICTRGGTIYSARKRYKWPGRAAVVVSVVHVTRGEMSGPFELDGRPVDRITAFLFHRGGDNNPATLDANRGKSYLGSKVYGQGFTFDDTDRRGAANPMSLMHELIVKDPRNAERIFPYIGGEEVNDSPTHAYHRYVINFGQMSEEEARRWPDLMAIVEEKVKPERLLLGDNPDGRRRKAFWWQWGRYTPALFDVIRGLDRVLVISQVTQYVVFAFLPANWVYSHRLYVIADDSFACAAGLQSRAHETWAIFFGSSLEDRFMYASANCYETFPIPQLTEALERAGKSYYDFRAGLMMRKSEGLTATYNRFHDPNDHDPDIVRLRELHAAIDRAVLDAYGWTEIRTACEFIPEYEENDEEEGERSGSRRRTRYRYRWPDEVRDEVLARLLELNRQRAEEERLLAVEDDGGKRAKTGSRKRSAGRGTPALF